MIDYAAAVSTAIALTKEILSLASVAKDVEAKSKIAELRLQLADIKTQMADLMEENDRLKRDLAKKQEPTGVVFKDGLYFKPDGDGPFCTTCFDSKKSLIRLSEQEITVFGKWRCGVCTSHYK